MAAWPHGRMAAAAVTSPDIHLGYTMLAFSGAARRVKSRGAPRM
jgi:hypothetical protein